jgi:hypothetical protein
MKITVAATQKLDYKIPLYPNYIQTVTGQNMPLESLSEDAISDIFDAMKENAIEYRRSKIVLPDQAKLTGAKIPAGEKPAK